jgi:hypothetical protein
MKNFCLLISVLYFSAHNTSMAQIFGCTDPQATNYNPSATINDGSCLFDPVSITPTASFNLSADIKETSGLIKWDNHLWTHNDNTDINLYSLDTINGTISQVYTLNGVENMDWEEISQDSNYVYIGDLGNNESGNRKDLRILRMEKNSLLSNTPLIETIYFSYANQTDFAAAGNNNTDFDCEAFIVSNDSIFLFTKQWISQKTSIYALPKVPGTYIAKLNSTYNVGGLITGATLLPSGKLIALSGYSTALQPFIYLLYDFKDTDYFSGNKRKISVSLPFHQVEGIATSDGLKYYISNETFTQRPINVPQKLHILDLSNFLTDYLKKLYNPVPTQTLIKDLLFPNPATDFINIKTNYNFLPVAYRILNQSGTTVLTGNLISENTGINISGLSSGVYILEIEKDKIQSFKVIKK